MQKKSPISTSLVVAASLAMLQTAVHADGVKFSYQGRQVGEKEYQAINLLSKATRELKEGDLNSAESDLAKSVSLWPQYYEARATYGVVLARQGKANEGLTQLKEAVQIAPDKPLAMQDLGLLYQSTGKLPEAIETFKEFAAKFPNDPSTPAILSMAHISAEELAREKEIAARNETSAFQTNYFPYATYEAVSKWSLGKFPLKVFIPSEQHCSTVPGFRPEFRQALLEAFSQWQQKAPIAKFAFVNDPASADIVCSFTEDPSKISALSEGGHAELQFDDAVGIRHCNISLLTVALDGTNAPVSTDMFKYCCLHEIGHALGIEGHSPQPADVMFYAKSATAAPVLTDRDVDTIQYLYRPDVKLVAHRHVNNSTNTGTKSAVALNNEGVDFIQAQDLAHAAEKFEAALQVNAKYEPARRNLAACLNNLAIMSAKSGNWSAAASQFKRAIELGANDPDKVKRAAQMQNYAIVLYKLNKNAEAKAMEAAAAKLKSGS